MGWKKAVRSKGGKNCETKEWRGEAMKVHLAAFGGLGEERNYGEKKGTP